MRMSTSPIMRTGTMTLLNMHMNMVTAMRTNMGSGTRTQYLRSR
jgi:hypothetical protein